MRPITLFHGLWVSVLFTLSPPTVRADCGECGVCFVDCGTPVMRPTRYSFLPAQPVQVIEPVVVQPRVVTVATPVVVTPVTYVDAPDPSYGDYDDPYDHADGLVIAGVSLGGLTTFGSTDGIVPAYRLHFGLAVDAAEFALRFDLAPSAMEREESGSLRTVGLYTAGASFNYRFLDRADVHPVLGIGLETIVTSSSNSGTAFAGTGRVGLELAYPVGDGALALGLDVTGHQVFGASEAFPTNTTRMLTFGAFVDYRF